MPTPIGLDVRCSECEGVYRVMFNGDLDGKYAALQSCPLCHQPPRNNSEFGPYSIREGRFVLDTGRCSDTVLRHLKH